MAKKPTQCTVCRHRERAAIDLALARGVSVRALAKRYKLGVDSLYRHQRNGHLPAQLRAKLLAGPDTDIDLDRLREIESQSLLANLVSLRQRLMASVDVAEESGDGAMVARVASQLHKNLELTGRLLGDLAVGSTTIQNVLVLPAYVEMRVQLVKALAPFPEARQAVAQVLHTIEAKAADDMKAQSRELATC
jgi:hypothetical protein